MGFLLNLTVLSIGIALTTFLNYPPPTPSKLLKQWRDSGTYFKFKDYNIFFQDVKGTVTDTVDENRTLLLIHGFPTSSLDWYKLIPDLQSRFHRIILPDLLGLGFSDKPTNYDYPVTFQADMIEYLMAHLQETNVDIVAHDLGDTVAQELLARFNDRQLKFTINSMTLLNGGIFPRKHIPTIGQKLLRTPVLGTILSRITNYYFYRASINRVFGANKPTDEELNDMWTQQRYLDGYRVLPNLLTYIDQRFANEDRWVGAMLKYSTSNPIHLISGPADPINPKLCENFKKIIPRGSCNALSDDIGHFPLLEDPAGLIKFYFAFLDRKFKKVEDGVEE